MVSFFPIRCDQLISAIVTEKLSLQSWTEVISIIPRRPIGPTLSNAARGRDVRFPRSDQRFRACGKEKPMTSPTLSASITAQTPLRLAEAARLAYPDGSITVSGLRREAKRGRLTIERVAGKDYTTLGDIERMRERCRVEAKARDSGFAQLAGTPHGSAPGRQSGSPGSSSMATGTSPQAAVRAKL